MRISLPNNWKPRDYQMAAWNYLENGGLHAELIWHRRSGKDEVALHRTCIAAFERPATYWHMLPKANQARKAIWEAVNPHTGIRRIDEAFPVQLRAATRENEMFIKFLNGSTWQVLGSDNFEGSIGSPPAGIVWSEWAQANPTARGYLRPILAENGGWQIFITTPRGKNHAYKTFQTAQNIPGTFAQICDAKSTSVFSDEDLEREKVEYIGTYGSDLGAALFEQEYMCSFDAAIMGAYYALEFAEIDKSGRIRDVPHDSDYPVYTAWDLGFDDDTAVWFYQVVAGEIHILEYYYASGKSIDFYCSQLLGVNVTIDIIEGKLVVKYGAPIKGLEHRVKYDYGSINVPHDARAKTLAAQGKSIQEQLATVFGWSKVRVVPTLSVEDGIQATRKLLERAYIDSGCDEGVEAVRQYRREWDDTKKMFRDKPEHDWTSHPADALRTMAVAWRDDRKAAQPLPKGPRLIQQAKYNDLWDAKPQKRRI